MDISTILTELRAELERINQAIVAVEALNGTNVSLRAVRKTPKKASPTTTRPTAKKRVMSPETRKRMAEAQQKRWAGPKKAAKANAQTA